jgi:hypothetical protein
MTIIEELLAVITADRERELEGLSRARRTQRSLKAAWKRDKAWIWRIEPGMEEPFESLRSWLLSSVRDSEVEQTDAHGGPP